MGSLHKIGDLVGVQENKREFVVGNPPSIQEQARKYSVGGLDYI